MRSHRGTDHVAAGGRRVVGTAADAGGQSLARLLAAYLAADDIAGAEADNRHEDDDAGADDPAEQRGGR
ncbi:hypothetical protein NLG97_g10213 [Lecanicillium saksenae]|uniref:Uncharacterized protein n=1 Tax=Lecanicillium saksenae TaxID=468837 RepID=A0ACC1QFH7_9HYPO|nr:hypothetical protein NLG97_g10213 [Lecanicillium saksenae]